MVMRAGYGVYSDIWSVWLTKHNMDPVIRQSVLVLVLVFLLCCCIVCTGTDYCE